MNPIADAMVLGGEGMEVLAIGCDGAVVVIDSLMLEVNARHVVIFVADLATFGGAHLTAEASEGWYMERGIGVMSDAVSNAASYLAGLIGPDVWRWMHGGTQTVPKEPMRSLSVPPEDEPTGIVIVGEPQYQPVPAKE